MCNAAGVERIAREARKMKYKNKNCVGDANTIASQRRLAKLVAVVVAPFPHPPAEAAQ
jgi:hypothetical protein